MGLYGHLGTHLPECRWCKRPYVPKRRDQRCCCHKCERMYISWKQQMLRKHDKRIMKEIAFDVFGSKWENLSQEKKSEIRKMLKDARSEK